MFNKITIKTENTKTHTKNIEMKNDDVKLN